MKSVLDHPQSSESADDKDKAAAGKVTDKPVRLGFHREQQKLTNWCWAAVAASVSTFYRSAPDHSQCHIANLELGRRNCCRQDGANGECNVFNTLASPLNRVDCLKRFTRDEIATRVQLAEELNAQRPLCARIAWPDKNGKADGKNGAHFVTIIGYDPVDDIVTVADPWSGYKTMPYNELKSSYGTLGGKWIDTYYTNWKKAPAA